MLRLRLGHQVDEGAGGACCMEIKAGGEGAVACTSEDDGPDGGGGRKLSEDLREREPHSG